VMSTVRGFLLKLWNAIAHDIVSDNNDRQG
jgi:Na+(H+)/acetate symporter ActP